MSHTYTSSLFHCVFSTKERRPTIRPDFQEGLWAYWAESPGRTAVRRWPWAASRITSTLISLPVDLTLARAMQLLKGGSSRWVHESLGQRDFHWQRGYGGFSVGISQVSATIAYISSQSEHHRRKTFQEEFLEILSRHGIEYDPHYVWG